MLGLSAAFLANSTTKHFTTENFIMKNSTIIELKNQIDIKLIVGKEKNNNPNPNLSYLQRGTFAKQHIMKY